MRINSPEATAINNEHRKKRGLPPWGEPDALIRMTVTDSRGIHAGEIVTINKLRYHIVRIEGNDLLCRYLPVSLEAE